MIVSLLIWKEKGKIDTWTKTNKKEETQVDNIYSTKSRVCHLM